MKGPEPPKVDATARPVPQRSWIRRNLGWIALIVVGFLGTAATVPLQIKRSQTQTRTEQEFLSITPPSDARAIRPTSSSTRINAVWNIYISELSYEELCAYYDKELAKRGWEFDGEESAIYGFPGNAERSGKKAFYKKGIYTATIRYAGPQEARESGYTYGFTVEWNWLDIEHSLRKLSAWIRGS
jgi:hypothetical protein